MANLKLKNPAGGSLALVSADGASDLTVTFPAVTGTAMVSGNMPAFAYTLNSSQSISVNTSTKVVFDTKVFDTANSVSSGRFTPTVAGYYQINANLGCAGTTTSALVCSIYKNGSLLSGNDYIIQYILTTSSVWISDIVYLNGSTDYLEIYGQVNAASGASFVGGNTYCKFSGCLLRTA